VFIYHDEQGKKRYESLGHGERQKAERESTPVPLSRLVHRTIGLKIIVDDYHVGFARFVSWSLYPASKLKQAVFCLQESTSQLYTGSIHFTRSQFVDQAKSCIAVIR
jgi:hypothetical protein